jgi:hypothetical protein
MRPPKALVASLLSLALLTAACSDDETDVDAGDDTDQTTDDSAGTGAAPDGSGVEVPDRAPDLIGTITTITAFEPVTEDCTPADEADPDGAASSDDPPTCTPEDNDIIGTILVEGDLAPERGRKISYTVTTDTKITGRDGEGVGVGVFADFAEGQTAETWVSGDMCAESYPEQCGLEAIRVTG